MRSNEPYRPGGRRLGAVELWQRRVTKGRRELVIELLRDLARDREANIFPNPKMVRAFRIAADLLEKLGEGE